MKNKRELMFSVLMSVYSKENPTYLKLAIDSVLNQTYPSNDIVIICDGELTSDLYKVLDDYAQIFNEINVIKFKENRGLGEALNSGLTYCKHDLVARMDTDDIARKDRFELQVREFQKSIDLAICGGQVEEFNLVPHDLKMVREVPLLNEEIRRFSQKRNPFNHMSVMFKKPKVLAVGGYQEFYLHEDYYLWMRMINVGVECRNISDIIVDVRVGNGMYERRGGLKYAKAEISLQKNFFENGYISRIRLITNILCKMCVRVLPSFLRKLVYVRFLRKSG